jgi:hypothetical protein
MIAEVNHNLGPWLQGGPATIRGVNPDFQTLIGAEAPLGGCYPDGAYFGYADGSARFIKKQIQRDALLMQLTIAGDTSTTPKH